MTGVAGGGDAPAARPLCPSAQPGWRGARVVGIVGGTAEAPRVGYLAEAVPAAPDLLARGTAGGAVGPDEVFRFAAPCAAGACAHFGEGRCRLARKIAAWLPAVVDEPPACAIRPDCRWWRQEGAEACRRCPQVVTRDVAPSAALVLATDRTMMPEAAGP